MYAIIETGGKQYKVEQGDVIDVELIAANQPGEPVEFKNVLFVSTGSGTKIGNPYLPASIVKAEFIEESKGPKVVAFKYKERKRIRRKVGHRQHYSRVKITEIIG